MHRLDFESSNHRKKDQSSKNSTTGEGKVNFWEVTLSELQTSEYLKKKL